MRSDSLRGFKYVSCLTHLRRYGAKTLLWHTAEETREQKATLGELNIETVGCVKAAQYGGGQKSRSRRHM